MVATCLVMAALKKDAMPALVGKLGFMSWVWRQCSRCAEGLRGGPTRGYVRRHFPLWKNQGNTIALGLWSRKGRNKW